MQTYFVLVSKIGLYNAMSKCLSYASCARAAVGTHSLPALAGRKALGRLSRSLRDADRQLSA